MNDLMVATDAKKITSLEIAELTGKRHKNVIRDIRNQLEELEIGETKFEHTYFDTQGKEQPMFSLDKEQSLILAGGYNIKLRQKIIQRWLELELQQPKTIEEMQAELLIAYQQRDLETTRSINHGYKSVIGVKNKVIDGVKEVTGAKLQRDVVESVNDIAIKLNETKDYATILTVQNITHDHYNWRELKRYCNDTESNIKEVPDPRYGSVKSYPASAWLYVYDVVLENIL